MELKSIQIENPDALNLILGQSHFIKTVEDIHEALVNTVPGIQFGVAFCEASGHTLIRHSGTNEDLEQLAIRNALAIGAGHSFIVFLKDAFPINVLHAMKRVPEICSIFCATANPVQVIVAESEQGRGILGVIDGSAPAGIEDDAGIAWRKDLLRKFGYKA
ncbi:adenosine-specific kinase [Candidatus Bipolaricaulota bacterium]|nr:adenosine-specific kinase [Candidatus Bipolaricaulota bacterium]